MAINSNQCDLVSEQFGSVETNNVRVPGSAQVLLNGRNAAALRWLTRIRTRLQELWLECRQDGNSAGKIHLYLTISNDEPRLQVNHVSCDGVELLVDEQLDLTVRLNQVLRIIKNEKLLSERPDLVGFWVELKA